MKSRIATAIGAAALVVISGAAVADTKTSSFNVTANVNKNCLVSSGDIAFGTYAPTTGALTGTSTVGVRCTAGTAFTVALSAGQEGSFAPRKLKDAGTNKLEYNLFTTNAYTVVWGDGTGTTQTQAGTGAGMGGAQAQNLTVYAQLPDNAPNQLAAPSLTYTDNITVTVTY
jgi:spore coat protein U domain-containing protein, fimbrial subunit CupE1/2/3/6